IRDVFLPQLDSPLYGYQSKGNMDRSDLSAIAYGNCRYRLRRDCNYGQISDRVDPIALECGRFRNPEEMGLPCGSLEGRFCLPRIIIQPGLIIYHVRYYFRIYTAPSQRPLAGDGSSHYYFLC